MQALFQVGEASPFESNEKGWSILDFAAWRSARKAYTFLLEQGAGTHTLYPRSSEITSLGTFAPLQDSEAFNCFEILDEVVRKSLTSTWERGGNHIHDLVYFDARWGIENAWNLKQFS